MPLPSVFLSYSHKDEIWKDRLRTHLRVLEQVGALKVWDDRRIDAGDTWYDEIKTAMDDAKVAVCLISADYLASDFCVKEEIPYLMKRREEQGVRLLPVLLHPCVWRFVPWLKSIQMLPRDGKTVSADFKGNEDSAFALVAESVMEALEEGMEATRSPAMRGGRPRLRSPGSPGGSPRSLPLESLVRRLPAKVDITRLPVTGAELFGRQAELSWLDEVWEQGTARIVTLVAGAGVGKSALVNHWLKSRAATGYDGARRVYGWSFQGPRTGDEFIDHALTWFGDPDPAAGSPESRGERLAELIRKEKTLLVLDGLEPLQISDPALSALLAGLARPYAKAGELCLITTRAKLTDLERFPETARQKELAELSPEAGRALLRVAGARGTDAELEEASAALGNHALALRLLALELI